MHASFLRSRRKPVFVLSTLHPELSESPEGEEFLSTKLFTFNRKWNHVLFQFNKPDEVSCVEMNSSTEQQNK